MQSSVKKCIKLCLINPCKRINYAHQQRIINLSQEKDFGSKTHFLGVKKAYLFRVVFIVKIRCTAQRSSRCFNLPLSFRQIRCILDIFLQNHLKEKTKKLLNLIELHMVQIVKPNRICYHGAAISNINSVNSQNWIAKNKKFAFCMQLHK